MLPSLDRILAGRVRGRLACPKPSPSLPTEAKGTRWQPDRQIESEQVRDERHVTDPRREAMYPTSIAPCWTRPTHAGAPSVTFNSPRCVEIQSAETSAQVQHEPKRPACRGRFYVQTNQPGCEIRRESPPALRPTRQLRKNGSKQRSRSLKNTREFLQRVWRNFNWLSVGRQTNRATRRLKSI
jgi:hypothetical protein